MIQNVNPWTDEDGVLHGTYTNDLAGHRSKRLLSLFDTSGSWSKPFLEAGWDVLHVDLQNWVPIDVMDIDHTWLGDWGVDMVDGVLVALPCTDFAASGARWWDEKDKDGRTELSVSLAYQALGIIEYLQPVWWCLENPVGRLSKLVPELQPFGPWYFQPCDFGDTYTKKTGLWGEFNRNLIKTPVEPVDGSKMHRIPPSNPDRAYLRSVTPEGFARAFFDAHQGA